MSGQANSSQNVTEVAGAASPAAQASQSVAEVHGLDTSVPALASQSFAEVTGLFVSVPASAIQCIVEVIAKPPPYVGYFQRERSFPLGYRNYPSRPPQIPGIPYS